MIRPVILGSLAYIIPTFPLAYFWHLKWFKNSYERWEYFGEPNVPLGFGTIVLQGAVLSIAYMLAPITHSSAAHALGFVVVFAAYHWSVHVLAAMAKNGRMRTWGYFGLETLYLALQFGIFWLLLTTVVY